MTVVEAKHPQTGRVHGLTEVMLTRCGLLIAIVDDNGNEALVHIYAWPGVVAAVEQLLEDAKEEARRINALRPNCD